MKVFRTKDIGTVDLLYREITGVTEQDLIERAAHAFVQAFIREEKKPGRVLVVAGPGNNGADARSVARLLTELGWQTDLWDFSEKDQVENQLADWTGYLQNLPAGTVVIDGLFGSGLTRPVTDPYARIIEGINALDTTVYAVDIPSGLAGDGIPFTTGAVVKASATFTFQFPKLSFFFAENYPYVGQWEVLDIGMGGMAYPEVDTPFRMTEESDIHNLFPRKRHPFSFKNNYGHALLIAGSLGKMGAAILSARSCLRVGTGLLTAHLPGRGEIPMQTSLPE
ncbi:MAG TPA: NAD(P)H-hydrate epimerase, partial [Bacteroidales bacterium]|nr:NAD(P)H-hydrate epimerase [Bacteroidales bacterium]